MTTVNRRPAVGAAPAGGRGPAPPPELPDRTLFATGGLSSAEAAARLSSDGPNELPAERRRGLLALAAGAVAALWCEAVKRATRSRRGSGRCDRRLTQGNVPGYQAA